MARGAGRPSPAPGRTARPPARAAGPAPALCWRARSGGRRSGCTPPSFPKISPCSKRGRRARLSGGRPPRGQPAAAGRLGGGSPTHRAGQVAVRETPCLPSPGGARPEGAPRLRVGGVQPAAEPLASTLACNGCCALVLTRNLAREKMEPGSPVCSHVPGRAGLLWHRVPEQVGPCVQLTLCQAKCLRGLKKMFPSQHHQVLWFQTSFPPFMGSQPRCCSSGFP